MKHEWRKHEKPFYVPKAYPEVLDIPAFKFFVIDGEGDPNGEAFPAHIEVLYSLAYAVKMSPKKGLAPAGYVDYTVYPLEGIWDLKAAARDNFDGKLNKDDLVFRLMIRQPDFVDEAFAQRMIAMTQERKPHPLLERVTFETLKEGPCIQMMHLGSYDNEPESFRRMEAFAEQANLQRLSKRHREIYLSDFRKVAPEKLKTVLRFQVAAIDA